MERSAANAADLLSVSKKSLVGADAHIGPSKNVTNLPKNGIKQGFFLRGDVGIAPYESGKIGFSTVCKDPLRMQRIFFVKGL